MEKLIALMTTHPIMTFFSIIFIIIIINWIILFSNLLPFPALTQWLPLSTIVLALLMIIAFGLHFVNGIFPPPLQTVAGWPIITGGLILLILSVFAVIAIEFTTD